MAIGKKYERNGKMMTINEIAKETGLSIESVRRQLKKKGDANLVGRYTNGYPPPLVNGKQYSWSQLSRMAGVSHGTIRDRVQRMGMTVEQAVANDNEKCRRNSETVKKRILSLWNCGETSIEDVERLTQYHMTTIDKVLPVAEIMEQERRDTLLKYGYSVS